MNINKLKAEAAKYGITISRSEESIYLVRHLRWFLNILNVISVPDSKIDSHGFVYKFKIK